MCIDRENQLSPEQIDELLKWLYATGIYYPLQMPAEAIMTHIQSFWPKTAHRPLSERRMWFVCLTHIIISCIIHTEKSVCTKRNKAESGLQAHDKQKSCQNAVCLSKEMLQYLSRLDFIATLPPSSIREYWLTGTDI